MGKQRHREVKRLLKVTQLEMAEQGFEPSTLASESVL